MMGEGAPSHLGAALRLLARGVRERSRRGGSAGSITPRRRAAVERAAIEIDPARVERYRRLTGGGGGKGEIVPPVYSSTWETALALELFAEGELPLPSRGLVHLASELVVLRALHPGERVRCRLELDRAEPHPAGTRVTLKSRNWNATGQLCQENSLTFLLRFPTGERERPRAAERETEGMGSAVEWRTLAEWSLPAALGRRYARVSGDFNPIHLWGWSSRLLGFDRPIAHGYCTQAMVASTLAERLWDSDPAALRRLFVRFRSPLLLPGRARLQVGGELERGFGRFQLVGPAPEARIFAEGEFLGG